MDRQVLPPGEDDGIGMSRILRRSGCETLRFVPLRLSRMAMQRPEFRTTYPWSVPTASTRSRNVRRCHGSRVPHLGENREEFVLWFGELREGGCCQRRPAASAVFSIQLPEKWPGTAPVAPEPSAQGVTATGGRRAPDRQRGLKTPARSIQTLLPFATLSYPFRRGPDLERASLRGGPTGYWLRQTLRWCPRSRYRVAVRKDLGDWLDRSLAEIEHRDVEQRFQCLLGASKPDVSRLLRGEFREYSLEPLLRLLTALRCDVDIVVRQPRPASAGTLRIVAAKPT